ncbi:MAG: Thioredoxin reductase [uncultured Chloroflexia bacterium]|uniref:Thioredoxin reductase n=1 Tax=uncultured Chloroflexia bacterium TaxID=1672391 RepID=A0A6J4LLH3_9CHLR|nr:MAG: Thioredoxin reductase [uncultured Chloroflexia bacterium]
MSTNRENQPIYDVIIVGGGYAGLSAALILGRCRRSVLLCDDSQPRNAWAHHVHGFLTRDGAPPGEMRQVAREQLGPYTSVEVRDMDVVDVEYPDGIFDVVLDDGSHCRSRKLLLATGVVDQWPEIEGAAPLYGRSIFHCPYCDGWELRDQPLAIFGRGAAGYGLALELTAWSNDLVLCTDGPPELAPKDFDRLARNGIAVREERITCLEGKDGMLERVVFADGAALPRRAIFFNLGQRQRSPLPEKFGCEFTEAGAVRTGAYESTPVSGLYIAGDASRTVQLAIIAAAEGAEAAFAINTALLKEGLR